MSGPSWWKRRTRINAATPPTQPVPTSNLGSPIRVTDERDGELLNRSYSYWSTCWIDPDGLVTLFVGHADGRPKFFRVNLGTGQVERLGALLGYEGTGEGMYFDRFGYIFLCDGPRLRRVDPFTGHDTVVMDISQSRPGHDLWQAHSDESGTVHSATVRRIVSDGKYPYVGTVVQVRGEQHWFGPQGYLDESAVTPDGRWLIIKELEVPEDYNTLYNRIISLADGTEYLLSPSERIGHSDCGPGCVVGEDSNRGWIAKFDFTTRERRKLLDTWAMGGVSYRGGRCLRSSATALSLVALDGSGETHLTNHGMIGDPKTYDYQCRASLDPTGRVACWLSNAAGRMDAYLLVLP